MDITTKIALNNGVEMPLLGFGTYQLEAGREAYGAVSWALEAGYRLVDTAACYSNETEVGRAVRDSGLPREDVFVTTKVWNTDQGYKRTLAAFDESVGKLGLDYVDLYLVHWPVPKLRDETWRAVEALYSEGRCRAVGVSNYRVDHLEELLEWAGVVPAVNQVEFSPFLYQRGLLEFCESRGIRLQAYAPLTRSRKFEDPVLIEIARRYGKTPAQVLIRWALQHGVSAIPKSSRRERIVENSLVFDFEIRAGDMLSLDSFDEELRLCWDPTGVE